MEHKEKEKRREERKKKEKEKEKGREERKKEEKEKEKGREERKKGKKEKEKGREKRKRKRKKKKEGENNLGTRRCGRAAPLFFFLLNNYQVIPFRGNPLSGQRNPFKGGGCHKTPLVVFTRGVPTKKNAIFVNRKVNDLD